MYLDESEYASPLVAHQMTPLAAVGSILDEGGKGGYRFDRMRFKNAIAMLSCFLGYMSGSIISRSAERNTKNVTAAV